MQKIFDSHTHYDDDRYGSLSERDELIKHLLNTSVAGFIAIGCSVERSVLSLELANKFPNVYASVGIHPSEAQKLNENDFSRLGELIKNSKPIAIGEVGLDYHYAPLNRKSVEFMKSAQKFAFQIQLELAREAKIPVIIHSRDATEDVNKILFSELNTPFLIHCFSGSAETAKELVKKGMYFGIGGTVTYKNAKKIVEAVSAIPISRIMLETDCPYLSPMPKRGERNSSDNLKFIAQKIAEIKEISANEVIETSNRNIKDFFRI